MKAVSKRKFAIFCSQLSMKRSSPWKKNGLLVVKQQHFAKSLTLLDTEKEAIRQKKRSRVKNPEEFGRAESQSKLWEPECEKELQFLQ